MCIAIDAKKGRVMPMNSIVYYYYFLEMNIIILNSEIEKYFEILLIYICKQSITR